MAKAYNATGLSDPIKPSRQTIEWTVRNKARYKAMSGPEGLDRLAGDGRWGFPNRRVDGSKIAQRTIDGEPYNKSARKTTCRPRKKVSKLVTTAGILRAEKEADPEYKARQEVERKKKHRNEVRAAQRRRSRRKP